MGRWQHTKDSDWNADQFRTAKSVRAIYKELIKFLNRRSLRWQHVEARVDFNQPEPKYNPIIINGKLFFADEELLDACNDIFIHHNSNTYSDDAFAIIELEFDRAEPLGTFSHSIRYVELPEEFSEFFH